MKCEWHLETVTTTQFPWFPAAAGSVGVRVVCRTHNFRWPDGAAPITESATQCPIGQIEDAADAALAKIAAARP